MHRLTIALLPLLAASLILPLRSAAEDNVLTVMEKVDFYDGYQTETIFDSELDDGVFRPANSLRCVRLSEDQTASLGADLRLQVALNPRCDNYDRMGLVRLAFVEKGAQTYDPEAVPCIEIARFITPFMNKNRQPRRVDFEWEIPDVAYILHDPRLRQQYDFWLETYIFGVPYSAQTQIAGCEGHNDVYAATVSFVSSDDADAADALADAAADNRLYPVYTTKSEIHGPVNLNSYRKEACDDLGVTTRTFRVNVAEDLSDAQIYLILTNHGAGENGEEYVRRTHFIYLDGNLVLTYMPGGVSCEPYRRYNSQGNGIYGREPLPDSEWEWNNWCPGSAQPIRRIPLGALAAGEHEIKISVPDAEFYNNDGDFRPSLFIQGMRKGQLPSSAIDEIADDYVSDAVFSRRGDSILYTMPLPAREVQLYDTNGVLLEGSYQPTGSVSLTGRPEGIYILVVTQEDGRYAVFKTSK